jgi:hypothetical protein
MTNTPSIGRHRILGTGMMGLAAIAAVAWDIRQDHQMAHFQELGMSKDLQWLGSTDGNWLIRAGCAMQSWRLHPVSRRPTVLGGRETAMNRFSQHNRILTDIKEACT